ncbi:ADP-ribosylation factor [Venturia nashicola]|uniref:ADP-ribosylation factor n=1 Tax=Venturia nashicola TaxID=86259 RepID=A0A4Z1P4V2_9PEZI|nr:ADP-ribosylation factor [Venturia nashicola]
MTSTPIESWTPGTGSNSIVIEDDKNGPEKNKTYDEEIETYTVPLREPLYYGAGVKKQGIKFVPASTPSIATETSKPSNVGNRYLEIVFGKKATSDKEQAATTAESTCNICRLPVNSATAVAHETSLAHQVCLEHIHPPSAIDRSRKGTAYLQDMGWDPDSRLGLGASGDGRLYPIQPKEKVDRSGIGIPLVSKTATPRVEKKLLNPKELRKLEAEKKRRNQRLHDMFYTDDRVARYLGPDV